MSNVLVVVEQAGGSPKKASLPGITFGQQVAQKSGGALHLVVIGADVSPAAAQLTGYGAAKVYVVSGAAFAHPSVEAWTAALAETAKACGANVIAAATSSTTKDDRKAHV